MIEGVALAGSGFIKIFTEIWDFFLEYGDSICNGGVELVGGSGFPKIFTEIWDDFFENNGDAFSKGGISNFVRSIGILKFRSNKGNFASRFLK